MLDLPTGTVTLVFTDIQGSSELWEKYGSAFHPVLEEHNRLLREAASHWNGAEVKTEGDAFFLAFSRATDAVQFAIEAQLALSRHNWSSLLPNLNEIRVRMGMHTGEPLLSAHPDGSPDYFGPVVNRAARVGAAGWGGQVVLSNPTYSLVQATLSPGIQFLALGKHRLRGVGEETLFQVVYPGLVESFPALKTLDIHPHNLPLQPTAFITREKELQEILKLLSQTRLLTLTGPGGTGKTRLALQAAEESIEDFSDGCYFVPMEAVTDPSLVPSTIAAAIEVREDPGKSLVQALKEHLRSKDLLLALDNFEQVTEAAPVVSELLASCPGLKVLVTSRRVLNLRGEQEYRVPPLEAPDPRRLPAVESLSQYAAVELFIQRARAAKPDFSVTNENAAAVAEICYRLDGLPLAIELAAARVKLLPPGAMLPRLQSRLKLLTGGSRDLPARQQTMRAAIAWGHDLLEEKEEALFRRMSVFAGGCTLEAVEAVCAGEPETEEDAGLVALDSSEALDLLSCLVDHSLVRQQEVEGEPRFRMLETLREFAREKLEESGEAGIIERRHGEYFQKLAEEAEPHLIGPRQAEYFQSLEREHDNLRSALEWSLQGAPMVGLDIAASLWRFWEVRGHMNEGRHWLGRALEKSGEQSRTEARAKALNAAGNLASKQGDLPAARALHEESLSIRRELGDREGVASCLNNLGNIVNAEKDYVTARNYFEEALATDREFGNRRGFATTLHNLGNVANNQGDYVTAHALYEESLSMSREVGDWAGIATSLVGLGNLAHSKGDHQLARSLFEESLAIRRELRDQWGIATSLMGLGDVSYAIGDYPTARTLYIENLAIVREMGNRRQLPGSLHKVGTSIVAEQDYPTARTYYEESLSLQRELGDLPGIASTLFILSILADYREDYMAAHALCDESLIIRRQLGDQKGILASLNQLGRLNNTQGDYQLARLCFEESLAINRELGDPQGIDSTLHCLGYLASIQGDYAAAQKFFEESLGIRRKMGDRQRIAESLECFGIVAIALEDYPTARTFYEESLDIRREEGDQITFSLEHLGRVAHAQGDSLRAGALYRERLHFLREVDDRRGVAEVLENLGSLTASQDNPGSKVRAVRLLAAAESLREAIGAPLAPSHLAEHEEDLLTCAAVLGPETFAAAQAEGKAMTLDQAVELALESDG